MNSDPKPSSREDKTLIVKYVNDYRKMILIASIIVVLFILASYPGYHLLPQYIFSGSYRGPSIVFGFMLFTVSLLNLKHGIITTFTRDFARKSALLGGIYGLFNKQALIDGTRIKYRGLNAKLLNYLSLFGSLLLVFLGFRS